MSGYKNTGYSMKEYIGLIAYRAHERTYDVSLPDEAAEEQFAGLPELEREAWRNAAEEVMGECPGRTTAW